MALPTLCSQKKKTEFISEVPSHPDPLPNWEQTQATGRQGQGPILLFAWGEKGAKAWPSHHPPPRLRIEETSVWSLETVLTNLLLGKQVLEALCPNCPGNLCSLEPGAQGHHHIAQDCPPPYHEPAGSLDTGDQGWPGHVGIA